MTTAETRTDRDVVELLLEQHDEIKSMFNELRQVQGPAKQELFNDLVRLLAVHETAEETVVHPVARRKLEDGEQVVEQRLEEEDRAKKELADLYDMGVDHPDFDRRVQAFAAEVTCRRAGSNASNPPRRQARIHRSRFCRDTRTGLPNGPECSRPASSRTSRPRCLVDSAGSAASLISW